MKYAQQRGFTLVEMLVVIAMMAIIMGFGIAMFTGAFKSSAVSASSRQMYTTLSLARQYAITQRTYVGVVISNDPSARVYAYAVVTNLASPQLFGRWEYLPMGATFTNDIPGVGAATSDTIWFRPSGSALQNYRLNITDGQTVYNYSSITVEQLLGNIRIQKP